MCTCVWWLVHGRIVSQGLEHTGRHVDRQVSDFMTAVFTNQGAHLVGCAVITLRSCTVTHLSYNVSAYRGCVTLQQPPQPPV